MWEKEDTGEERGDEIQVCAEEAGDCSYSCHNPFAAARQLCYCDNANNLRLNT